MDQNRFMQNLQFGEGQRQFNADLALRKKGQKQQNKQFWGSLIGDVLGTAGGIATGLAL